MTKSKQMQPLSTPNVTGAPLPTRWDSNHCIHSLNGKALQILKPANLADGFKLLLQVFGQPRDVMNHPCVLAVYCHQNSKMQAKQMMV